ncbi:DUF3892 domain-containing protein [Parvibaculum sp.]|uniref:DUF3892 domain-containing protein n=1 Tax=Parvibaculum sp. TaxID=2024848 RepID=UPI0032995834
MANRQTIRCINKIDRDDPYDRIKNVGGLNPDGQQWTLTQPEAIQHIDAGWDFFVGEGAFEVKVVTAVSPYGNRYLKTEADGRDENNLLSLPECP